MKTKQFCWILSALAVWSWTAQSCSQDDVQEVAPKGNVITLNASFEGQGSSTRTTMNDTYQVLWAANDQFALFGADGTKNDNDFTLSSGEGTTSGTFTGTMTSSLTPAYAVFPASQATSVSGTTLTMTLPSTITNYTGDSNGPMLAKGFYDNGTWSNLAFKHLAAMLKLTVNKFPAGATTLEITASNVIAGTFTATLSDANPELTYTGSDGTNKITASFTEETTSGTSKTFYFPMPVGTYNSIVAKLTDGSSKTFFEQRLTSDITLNRRDIFVYPAFDYVVEVTGNTPKDVSNAISNAGLPTEDPGQEQTTTISIPSAVNVTSESKAIEVPVVSNSNITLSFGAVPTGTTTAQPLEINGKESTQSNEKQNEVVIAIPQVSQETEAPHMTLNLSKSTVILEATGETATFGTVIASTAENTLIVKKGVTVKELVIGKGNVEVYGVVEKISRSSENLDNVTTVTSYGEADIQVSDENSRSKMEFKSTWDGVSKVAVPSSGEIYTAAQLASLQSDTERQKVTSGANLTPTITTDISLHTDVDLDNQPWYGMVLGENLTFNGNGHKILNLSIAQSIMNDSNPSTKYQYACAGFFAAAKSGSTVTGITISGGGTNNGGVNSKWMGTLIGHCLAYSVTDCHVENVSIVGSGSDSFRVGGLIGFIGSGDPTIENCSVENAYIEGYYSLGGLVGSVMCNSIYNNCHVSGISFKQKTTDKVCYGAVSNFIGDPEMTGGSRKVTISKCTSQPLSASQKTALKFYQITKTENEKSYYYDDDNLWVGIVSEANLTLTVGGTTWTKGTDYSTYCESSSQGGSTLPGYGEEQGEWD